MSDIHEDLRRLPRHLLIGIADLCDGHTILPPEALIDVGLPASLAQRLSHEWRSDGTPKGTIYINGEPVESMHGIYGLDLLQQIAAALNVSYEPAHGRGSEARRIRHAIRTQLGQQRQRASGGPSG